MNFYANETHTNATVASELCGLITGTTTTIEFVGVAGKRLVIPDCVRAQGTVVYSFVGANLLIQNFTLFPSKLNYLTITSSIFAPLDSSLPPTPSIDANGNINWDSLFASLPSLKELEISTSDLYGSLPTVIPTGLSSFHLISTNISGTIPSKLFKNTADTLSFSVSDSQLSGTIPADLFEEMPSANGFSLQVTFDFSQINGSIPPTLLYPMAGKQFTAFELYLSNNKLSGAIPTTFIPDPAFLAATGKLTFDWRANQLTGTIPSDLFAAISTFDRISLYLGSNQLIGPLPPHLFSGPWTASPTSFLDINLSKNNISGAIPEGWLSGGLAQNLTISTLTLSLAGNLLTGPLPKNLFYAPVSTKRDQSASSDDVSSSGGSSSLASLSTSRDLQSSASESVAMGNIALHVSSTLMLDLGQNLLTGSISDGWFETLKFTAPSTFDFDIADNNISGIYPRDLLSHLPDSSSSFVVKMNLGNTSISGALPDFCWSVNLAYVYYSDADFTGAIPESWASCSFNTIDISGLSSLTSTIPEGILNRSSLVTFKAAHTPLTGTLPSVSSSLKYLDLAYTNIDFCDTPDVIPALFMGSCYGSGTAMCTCQSSSSYSQCFDCSAPISPPPSFSSPPLTMVPSVGIPAVGTPLTIVPSVGIPTFGATPTTRNPTSSIPTTAARRCTKASRPSEDFVCIDGTWTANSTNTTTLTLPQGAGTVLVTGNLTSTTVVIQGIGSTINVTGSVTNLTTITVELTPQEISTLSGSKTLQILLTTNGNSSDIDLSLVGINTKATSGCKKVTAQKVLLDGGHTLGAYFSVDKSGCKTWWIILVSVVAAVVVLAVIVLALLAAFYKPFRAKIRPYSGRRKTGTITSSD